MSEKPKGWVSKEEMERDGFTLDHDIDDVPDYGAGAGGEATGLTAPTEGESSPPPSDKQPV
jgi:hypothetical protein